MSDCIAIFKMESRKLLVSRKAEEIGFSYEIRLESGFQGLEQAMKDAGLTGKKACIISDSTVAPLYEEALRKELSKVCTEVGTFVFPAGESNKNLDTIQNMYEHLILQGLDRKSLLVALGGGVVGDMTGFGAATYLRGIDFIQVPTTLLAQVDSSIGGKTGVDFLNYKNMVGAFHQPRLVYMNLDTLDTLPDQQFACGMGEVLKSALICDKEFYQWLEDRHEDIKRRDSDILAEMISRCCAIKRGVVERDPEEKGERALLNLGHTIGHAVEKLKDLTLLHGQCVGAGMVAAARISRNRGLLTEEEFQKIKLLNQVYGLPCKVDGLTAGQVLAATKKDKKMEDGHVKFILMDGLGRSFIDKTVSDEELLQGIEEIL